MANPTDLTATALL